MIKLKNFLFNPEEVKSSRGLEKGGAAQKYVDSEVIRLMEPYTPLKDGVLRSSPQGQSQIGSGKINQQTRYARRLFYNPQYNFNGAPRRGGDWFGKMKSNHKPDILRGVAKIVKARVSG